MTAPPPIHDGLFVDDHGRARLIAGACGQCDKLHFPNEGRCPYCGGADTRPRHVGPEGVVRLCTLVHRAPPGYAGPTPYGFGVVEIPGTGLEIVSRIATEDAKEIAPGQEVRLALVTLRVGDTGDDATTWTFEAR